MVGSSTTFVYHRVHQTYRSMEVVNVLLIPLALKYSNSVFLHQFPCFPHVVLLCFSVCFQCFLHMFCFCIRCLKYHFFSQKRENMWNNMGHTTAFHMFCSHVFLTCFHVVCRICFHLFPMSHVGHSLWTSALLAPGTATKTMIYSGDQDQPEAEIQQAATKLDAPVRWFRKP